MAEPAEPFAIIPKSELSCPMCSKLFVNPYNPKELPQCQHVCCEICLANLVKEEQNSERRIIVCPECEIESDIPDGGIAEIKTNLRLQNLAEKQEKYTTLKIRNRLQLDNDNENFDRCANHQSESVLFYCVSCSDPICQRCLVPDHLNHVVKEQEVIINIQKQQISEQIEAGNQELTLCQELMDEICKTEDELKHSLEAEHENIQKTVNNHYAQIREEEHAFMEQLQRYEMQQNYQDKLKADMNILENRLKDFNAMQVYIEQQQDDEDLMKNYKAIMVQLEDLCEEQPVLSFDIDVPNTPPFIPLSIPSTLPNLGQISETEPIYDDTCIEGELDDTYDTICDGHLKEVDDEDKDGESCAAADGDDDVCEKKRSHSYEWTIIEFKKPSGEQAGPSASDDSSAEEIPSKSNNFVKLPPERTTRSPPKQKANVQLQLTNEFGNFTDATSIASGNGIIAVCDRQRQQTSVWKKQGHLYRIVSQLRSNQPRDVSVLNNGAIVIANGVNAEMHSPSHIYETVLDFKPTSSKRERSVSEFSSSGETSFDAANDINVESEVNEAKKTNAADKSVEAIGSFAFRRSITSKSVREHLPPTASKEEERWFRRLSKRNSTGSRDLFNARVPLDENAEMHFESAGINYCKSIIHTTKGGVKGKRILQDIQSVVTLPDNHLLLGDTVRQVITRHTASGSLLETIRVEIKPYVMTIVDAKRIVISDYERILIKDINGGSKLVTYGHVYGFCYTPLVADGLLFVSKRKRSGFRGYQVNKGTLDGYELNYPCEVSECNTNLTGQLLGGLYKPGGMVLISDNDLAVADKKSVKIYKFVQ